MGQKTYTEIAGESLHKVREPLEIALTLSDADGPINLTSLAGDDIKAVLSAEGDATPKATITEGAGILKDAVEQANGVALATFTGTHTDQAPGLYVVQVQVSGKTVLEGRVRLEFNHIPAS